MPNTSAMPCCICAGNGRVSYQDIMQRMSSPGSIDHEMTISSMLPNGSAKLALETEPSQALDKTETLSHIAATPNCYPLLVDFRSCRKTNKVGRLLASVLIGRAASSCIIRVRTSFKSPIVYFRPSRAQLPGSLSAEEFLMLRFVAPGNVAAWCVVLLGDRGAKDAIAARENSKKYYPGQQVNTQLESLPASCGSHLERCLFDCSFARFPSES